MNELRSAKQLTTFTQKEVKQLFKSSRMLFKQDGIEVKQAPAQKPHGRILIVIPRIVGNAVKRNKLRRRIKNIYIENTYFEQPVDTIIFARYGAADLSYEALEKILAKAFSND